MPSYVIGLDYGSLSGRAVLVDCADGRLVASAQLDYPHAIMDRQLPDGTRLSTDWALQHPQDYLDVLSETIPQLVKEVDASQIVGIGLDVTCSTMLPVDAKGTPLCFMEKYRSRPHAYVMMWKHHACQDQAQRLTDAAIEMGETWLNRYGGRVNAEWSFPKLLQVFEEAPDIYQAMAHYVEATDWLVWQLTGSQSRSAACLGYKAFYTGRFPEKSYFARVKPGFENVVEEKLSGPIRPLGACAGHLTQEAAARYGLKAGIPVAVGNIDAHVCLPAMGIDGPGKLLAIVGTSTCHIVMGEDAVSVPGMSGVVDGGVLPGYAAYEAGQSCVGDIFHWFQHTCTDQRIHLEAQERNLPLQVLLTEKAAALTPGESGLLALDWWNGNRSVLAEADLSGMLLGMTLQTRPEEIYRALIESTAYGARVILEAYRENGVPVHQFFASGGIPQKNGLMMQIYADVLNLPVHIAAPHQCPAFGSAIFAAVAAGVYKDAACAARVMGKAENKVYTPIPQNVLIYQHLFEEYQRLHDYFGRGENDVMKRLKRLRTKCMG